MALYNFKNQVGNGSLSYPANLSLPLSSKNVTIDTFGANAVALLFNDTSLPLSNTYAALTFGGCSFRVDVVYNGVQFALLSGGNLATVFTCATATAGQTATAGTVGIAVASPDWIRKWNLEG
ncbi:hypothetical protein EBU95_13460 [bacterium]|nr:hypothetical protein [bacterium]